LKGDGLVAKGKFAAFAPLESHDDGSKDPVLSASNLRVIGIASSQGESEKLGISAIESLPSNENTQLYSTEP